MSRIGIDTGGTFTDFIWLDEAGQWRLHKQPSTPDDPARAVLSGLAAGGAPPAAGVVHGSTVATNALLQRRGARTALITTAGFGDVLEIGRQNRPELYALVPQKPPPLVPSEWRFEAHERVGAAGEVVTPLDEAALAETLARLAVAGVESVAVCLLFSFLRPEHERRIGVLLAARLPEAHVSLSCDILPEYREFERTAATVINAYVAPLMGRYLSRLSARLAPRSLAVMQSNGGVISAELAGAQAARTALSGPAGGVVGARHVASRAGLAREGFGDIITFDMGGTSTDVALCPGRTPTTTEAEIAGLPLRLPIIDIHTVGAGGGSLAYLDAGGALHVGPESAGASPGPACYHADYDAWRTALDDHFPAGWATVTDANVVLGRLDVERFLGGEMPLYEQSAFRAVGALAEALGPTTTTEGAALAILRVANATMERAIRRISVERGYDPRQFTLVAFGGNGPLHVFELAEALRIPRVLIPRLPGVLSALGMMVTAPARDTSQTVMRPVGNEVEWLAGAFAPLAERARREMAAEGHDPAALTLRHTLDMRYVGQSHELSLEYRPAADAAQIAADFHAAHDGRYGYARPDAGVEIVTLRLSATATVAVPELANEPLGVADSSAALLEVRDMWYSFGMADAALYDRARLRPGNRFAGPAAVYQYDTTTLVPPGWIVEVDGQHNLLAQRHVSLF